MLSREPRWPMFHRVWRRSELTEQMVSELGIDPIVAARLDEGRAYREACLTCLMCTAPSRCRGWLDTEERAPIAPDFCPNAAFFDRCLTCQSDQQ